MVIALKLEEMLHYLKKQKEKYNNELRKLPEGNLISTVRDGQITYMQVVNQEGTYKRKSITRNKRLQRELARKKYIELQLSQVEKDIKTLEAAKCRLGDSELTDILEKLPKAYRSLPEDYFFEEEVSDWASRPYKQSTFKPENRRFTTSRYLKVRSKSELLIAEKLYEHDIEFRYEQVIPFENIEFAPDFTIRRKSDGKIFYWEHCGRTSDEGYNNYNRWKMAQYEKLGIVPWDNLIVTYDSEDGILNIPLIESEIINKLKR